MPCNLPFVLSRLSNVRPFVLYICPINVLSNAKYDQCYIGQFYICMNLDQCTHARYGTSFVFLTSPVHHHQQQEKTIKIICQINKQYNYTNDRNTLTGCQGKYKPINVATYDNYRPT